jgi:Domain of unknown function (DUF4214)/Glycosyl hydrolase catalytic core
MRFLMLRQLTLAIGALLALATTASAELLWGANGHPFNAYPGVSIERQLDYVKDLGMKSYRVNISGPSSIDALAALVREGKKRGVEILPVITPGLDLDKEDTDALYEKARKLAFMLGSRFRGQISVWELGNEMENYAIIQPCEMRDNGQKYSCEWGPAGGDGPLDYFGPRWKKASAVLNGLSVGMKQADPAARRAMGTAGWGHTGAFERMQQDGIEWDISVWHMYGQNPEWAFKELARYGHPIWVTEFNNPYGSQHGEHKQVEGLADAMKQLRELQAKYNVEAAHIYELMDETYWAPDFEAYMGLIRLTGSQAKGWTPGEPKPAYFAVRNLIRGQAPAAFPQRDCNLSAMSKDEPLEVRQAGFAYCLVLGRRGSTEEIARRASEIERGEHTFDGLLISMLRSEEFSLASSDFGMTDRDYVDFLFRWLLGRPADGQGLESYARQLRDGSMTRANVAGGIVTSSEFAGKYAATLDMQAADSVPPG